MIFNHHTAILKWIRKSLDFLRKTPLTAYEFGIIRKSITNWKADRPCRTAFSGFSTPENHTPLSCFKIDGLNFAPKPTQKPSIFVSKIIIFSFRTFILFIHQKWKGKRYFNRTIKSFKFFSQLFWYKNILIIKQF